MENKNLYSKNKTEWYRVRLGEIVSYKKGYAFKSDNYKSTGVRIVKISDTTESSIKSDNITCVDVEKYNEYKEWALIENDVIISTVGSRPPLYDSMVGKVVKVPSSCNNALLNQNMVRLRTKENVNQQYLYHLLKTRRYLNHIENICRGNANQVSITLDELFDYKIDVPPLKEQEKIVEILSTWDLAMEKQEQLIEKKKEFKKGLMQRLLSGEVRFKEFTDEWKVVSLGSIFERVTEKNNIECNNVLTISAQNGLVNQEEYFNKSVSSNDLSGYYLLKKGDFAYNKSYSNGYPLGAIKRLNNYEEGVVSPLYICFRAKERISTCFYEQYFESGALNKEIMKIAQEGARNHGLLNISVTEFFKDIKIVKPAIEEQNKIAEVLIQADREIELLQKELEALKLQKKGLMQRLLTGEVRVKV